MSPQTACLQEAPKSSESAVGLPQRNRGSLSSESMAQGYLQGIPQAGSSQAIKRPHSNCIVRCTPPKTYLREPSRNSLGLSQASFNPQPPIKNSNGPSLLSATHATPKAAIQTTGPAESTQHLSLPVLQK